MVISILVVLVLLNVLILVHEFGHFIFAKWSKAHVQEFSIGIGPKIFRFKLLNTPSFIRVFPIGGYVSLVGEVEDEGPGSFIRLSAFRQLLIVLGGVIFNAIFAYFVFLTLMIIRPKLYFPDIGLSPHFASVTKTPPLLIITKIQNNSDLKRYLKDSSLPVVLWKINDKKINSFNSLKTILKHHRAGDMVSLTYCLLNGNTPDQVIAYCNTNLRTIHVKLLQNSKLGVIVTELSASYWNYVRFFVALRPVLFFYDIGNISLLFLKNTINSAMMKHDYQLLEYTVGGPVSVIPVVSNILSSKGDTMYQLFFLLGLFSINLAFINILPFPGLDGWHVVLVFIRKLISNVNINKFLKFLTTIGLLILFILAIIITIKDINLVFFTNYGK